MATTESNALAIGVLQTQLAELLSKSVLPSEMDATQRKALTDAIYPNGVALQFDNPDVVIDDLVYGRDSEGFFFGRSNVNAPSSRADITIEIEW